MRAGLAVALVDPGTLLARDVKSVLEERGFPYGHVSLFHSRSASDGLLVDDDGEAALALPLAKDSLASSDVAFFCGRAEDTQRFLKIRGRDGCVAIDLSGLREGGPFVSDLDELPDVSRGLLLTRDPTALVVADALRRFRELVEITSVDLAIDRPASGSVPVPACGYEYTGGVNAGNCAGSNPPSVAGQP